MGRPHGRCVVGGLMVGPEAVSEETPPLRRTRGRGGNRKTGEAPVERDIVKFTPPCSCGYPLVKTDRLCARCGRKTAWADTLPPFPSDPEGNS